MRYVIIGNSAAAVGCIEGIRQLDKGGSVTVISSEPYHTYSRPLISYLLWGKTTEEGMKYRPDGFYENNGCRTLLGRAAVGIDPEKKQVTGERPCPTTSCWWPPVPGPSCRLWRDWTG